jgi:hypothetical protein
MLQQDQDASLLWCQTWQCRCCLRCMACTGGKQPNVSGGAQQRLVAHCMHAALGCTCQLQDLCCQPLHAPTAAHVACADVEKAAKGSAKDLELVNKQLSAKMQEVKQVGTTWTWYLDLVSGTLSLAQAQSRLFQRTCAAGIRHILTSTNAAAYGALLSAGLQQSKHLAFTRGVDKATAAANTGMPSRASCGAVVQVQEQLAAERAAHQGCRDSLSSAKDTITDLQKQLAACEQRNGTGVLQQSPYFCWVHPCTIRLHV